MKNSTKKILGIIFLLSIALNIAVISLDTVPFLWPKLKTKFFPVETIKLGDDIEDKVVTRSIEMLDGKSVSVWSDPGGFTKTIFDIIKSPHPSGFKTYNYPKAFLYFGLSNYLVENKDKTKLTMVKKSFDKILDAQGRPVFKLDKVDQIPYGLTAINLYKIFGDKKYLNFCTIMYNETQKLKNIEGIILYRENQPIQLSDVIGMIVPFLVEYGETFNNKNAINDARNQLQYYIKYGVDKETYLPTHGINIRAKIKVGPTNWGRGIGWYFIGLSHFYNATGEFKEEFDGLSETLVKVQTDDKLWSQFPGSSDYYFDASSSLMFLYSMNNKDRNYQILNKLSKYISKDGSVLQTSGDTYGINDYSKSFGKSEMSQGFLLLLLSK
jgi:unsaturated rhamnogalacturonyl hydrolase